MATANISKQEINTGILYARAIPLAALHRFNQNDTVTRSYFLQAARELKNAAYDAKHHKETKELRNIADRNTYRDNLTPIGILLREFTDIDTLAGHYKDDRTT